MTLSHDLDRNHARPDHAAGSIQHVFRELETIEICRGAAPQPPVDMRRFNRASRLSFNLAKKLRLRLLLRNFRRDERPGLPALPGRLGRDRDLEDAVALRAEELIRLLDAFQREAMRDQRAQIDTPSVDDVDQAAHPFLPARA